MTMMKERHDTVGFVASGLKDIKYKAERETLDVIIDIGLILSTLGKKEDDSIVFRTDYLELRELTIDTDRKDYYVCLCRKSSKSIVFHVIVDSARGIQVRTFIKGPWEKSLRQFSETQRSIYGTKEKPGNI